MRTIVVTVAAFVVVLPVHRAHASWCTVDGVFAEITPPADSKVAQNVRIRVRLTLAPAADGHPPPPDRIRLAGSSWSQRLDKIAVYLYRVDPKTARRVAVDVRHIGMGNERILELVPRQPLPPNQRYRIEVSDRRKGKYKSEFTTTSSTDSTPPTWSGITRAEVERWWRPLPPRPGKKYVVITSSADRSLPWVVVHAPKSTDESTPGDEMRFAVWIADAAGHVDYAKPPLSYLRWHSGRILAGRDRAYPEDSLCDLPQFPLPETPTPLRIGIRAVDWAGNVSTPSEAILDASAPKR